MNTGPGTDSGEERVFFRSTNSITLGRGGKYELEYLLGLLNSTLFQWRFKLTSTNNNVGTNELEGLPFRTIDFGDAHDRARHDRMVQLVERMLQLQRTLRGTRGADEQEELERRLDATNEQIDLLTYEAYGCGAEDIALIERHVREPAVQSEATGG